MTKVPDSKSKSRRFGRRLSRLVAEATKRCYRA